MKVHDTSGGGTMSAYTHPAYREEKESSEPHAEGSGRGTDARGDRKAVGRGRVEIRPRLRPGQAAHSRNSVRKGRADGKEHGARAPQALFHPHQFHRARQGRARLLHWKIRRDGFLFAGKRRHRLARAAGKPVLFRPAWPRRIHRARRSRIGRIDAQAAVRPFWTAKSSPSSTPTSCLRTRICNQR